MKHLIITLLFSLYAVAVNAQGENPSVELSSPIDISADGWNKLLQMKNGNTLLFHFERKKQLVVKVFDKEHKQIATNRIDSKQLNINQLENTEFKGLLDVNGEAVLFTEEVSFGHDRDVFARLRFNGQTGKLEKEEDLLAEEHKGVNIKAMLATEGIIGYSLLYEDHPKQIADNDTVKIILKKINEKHEVISEVPFSIQLKQKDKARYLDAKMTSDGSVFACYIYSDFLEDKSMYTGSAIFLYLPASANHFIVKITPIPADVEPSGISYVYNAFASNVNVMFNTERPRQDVIILSNGINGASGRSAQRTRKRDFSQSSFLILPEDLTSIKRVNFDQVKANEYVKTITQNPIPFFNSLCLRSFDIDGRGVTSMTLEQHYPYWGEVAGDHVYNENIKNIIVTRYDDNGNELWGYVVPKQHHFDESDIHPEVFGHSSQNELCESLVLYSKSNNYILFNNPEEDFNKSLADTLTSVNSYDNTNTVYYHINKKNIVTKMHFFGDATNGIFKQIYPNSAHFDNTSNSLAVLVRQRKDKDVTYHIAWSNLKE